MPPQKDERKSTEKMRSVRKPKSHLNMPVNLKISIPLQGTEQKGVHVPIVRGRRPPQFIKHLDIATKVDLANSVARQQLVKEEPPIIQDFQLDNVVLIPTPKPKGRKKKVKVLSDFFVNRVGMGNNTAEVDVTSTDTKLPQKLSPVKKPSPVKNPAPTRKILTRKRLADSKAQEDAKRSKVETETDTETHDAIVKLEVNAVDEPVEPECDPFVKPMVVQPTSVVLQLTPVDVQPTSEMVQLQPKKSKCSVKRLQPTAKKPPPMRQPTPGRRRGSKGKQQNVQASIETPSIVDLLKNKVTESEVKTKQNQQNAPGLVESRKSSVGSSPNLSRNQVTEAEVKTNQNQLNAPKSRMNSVGSTPNLLKDQLTEAVVKTKQNQLNAPGLVKSRKKSVGSSPNLSRNKVRGAVVKANQNQLNAPGLVKSRKKSVGISPNLSRNKVTEAEVKTNENQQIAPGLAKSQKNSVGSSPNLGNKATEAGVKTNQNQQIAPGLAKSQKNSVGSSPNLGNKATEAGVKTNQNQQIAPGLAKSQKNSVGSSPNLGNKATEAGVKTNQNQQIAPGLAKSQKNSVGSSPNLGNKATEADVKTNQNQLIAPGLAKSHKNSVGSSPNLGNKATEAGVKTNQNQKNAPGLVDSRKNSVGSSSNKSWTRDISSSSNYTSIGSVCSNDFVRINKKLPVLKLTNIDSEVKKRQKKAQEIAASAAVNETDEDLSDSYDSDSSDGEKKFSEQLNDSLGENSLHLSATSSSQFTQSRRKESSSDYPKASSSDYGQAANKLSLTMEKLDLEIIKWMNSDNENVNANLVKFRDKMFDILDREFGVITHCRHLKEMLNPPKEGGSIDETCVSKQVQDCDANNDIVEENTPAVENSPVVEKAPALQNVSVVENAPGVKNAPSVKNAPVVKNVTVLENALVVKKNPIEENTLIENHTRELVKKDLSGPKRRTSRHRSSLSEGECSISNASAEVSSDDETAPGTSYPYYDHHDDDDTLSLFAESISGFESSRMNTSIAAVDVPEKLRIEEYIPKPVKENYVPNTEKQTYCPTKIREDPEIIASKIINVCEKQNADSTSIYKQSNSTDDAESYQDFTENIELDTRLGPPDMIKKPRLMDSYYEALPKSRSVVFNTLCYYNLMNCCRKIFYGQCRFLHLVPTSAQIKEKLSQLDERMLIQEYLLLRKWSELRRRYGMCYVEECAKRGLTRILIEMAYDFIVKARNECEEDTRRRVNAIELTLLHLNTVDLSICEDLLKLTIHSDQVNRTLLCDVFMATMSITQNFSRFKIVFLNLTYFMVDNDRTFNKDVVEHILERVCILPFEEPIARALIQMMRLTKSDIFNNSMIGHFEKQISVNKDVFEDYTLLKNQWAFSSMLASSVVSPSPPLQATPARPDAPDPQPPAASPDTTNLDNANKAAEEPSKPVITRTIGMNPAIIFNRAALSSGDSRAHVSPGLSTSLANPGSSKSYINNTESDTSDESNKPNIRKWRNRSIFPHILPPPMVNQGFRHGSPTRGIRGTSTRGTMRPPMWPQMRPPQRLPFNHRQVTFKPPNYVHRQPGPQY